MMIRYKEDVFEEFFIDPETGVITNSSGEKVPQHLVGKYLHVRINGMDIPVHCIQAHTWFGYRPTKIIHHKNHIKTDNSVNNLDYNMTQAQHQVLHKRQSVKKYGKYSNYERSLFDKMLYEKEKIDKNIEKFEMKKLEDL